MTHNILIHYHNIHYKTPHNQCVFKDLSLSFGNTKTAVVGKNGVGKTTLLKLMLGELMPQSGFIDVRGTVAYCPQDLAPDLNQTVAECLGIAEKLLALERIACGSVDAHDYEVVDGCWALKERTLQALQTFYLSEIPLTQKLSTLSGGEITKLSLCKAFMQNPDFLVLDEPTNNLDFKARALLYKKITMWQKGLIVVSHDRALLSHMDKIVELTALGVKCYQSCYEDYIVQRTIEREACERAVQEAKKQTDKTKQSIQCSRERQEQRTARGIRSRKTENQHTAVLNNRKNQATWNQGRISIHEKNMSQKALERLESAKAKIEIAQEIKIDLPKTKVHSRKVILQLEDLSFSYDHSARPLIHHYHLIIRGPERIVIQGDNGTGKTTLVKLICGHLQPQQGKIKEGVLKISYLDQHVGLLDAQNTILENFQKLNPDIIDTDARRKLDHFLFRDQAALKFVQDLSPGERLRAALACLLLSNHPPQLLILDEPTNHLDLTSVHALECALNCYQGALMIISHDVVFLQQIYIKRVLQAPFVGGDDFMVL